MSGFRSGLLLHTVAVMFTIGCSTTTQLEPARGSDGKELRRFRVDCVEMTQCRQRATVACGTRYQIVSEWHNEIPESELPGLNDATTPKDTRDYDSTHAALPNRTGIESDDPMPLASIVVTCNG